MRIDIRHEIRIDFGEPPRQPLLRLRLTPYDGAGQTVERWALDLDNCVRELDYDDHHGNRVTLIRANDGADSIAIVGTGAIATDPVSAAGGRPHSGFVPLWLFRQPTALTRAGQEILRLASRVRTECHDDDAERLNALSDCVRRSVRYRKEQGSFVANAEKAFRLGKASAIDHCHIFMAAARSLGVAARIVSGYRKDKVDGQEASLHSWVEAYIEGSGWVWLDVTNGGQADEHYVRLAVGRDYLDAAPLYSTALIESDSRVAVSMQIQQ